MLNAHARTLTDRLVQPVARALVRLGLTPNALTTAGLLVTLAGAAVVVTDRPVLGATIMAAGLVLDAFDGAVARLSGRCTPLGAFYDSVADRLADLAILGALVWLVLPSPLGFAVGMTALATALLTSYIRAKAESLGLDATVGVLERAERLVIVLLGLWLDLVALALWVLAVGGVVTVLQRVVVVWRQARALPASEVEGR
ncbi:MAG: CDP-alcohol phosphatidyltransferase family protein [Egibacteraceae bacterium]